MIDRFMTKRSITNEIMQESLTDKFHDFIEAIVSGDKETINKMSEKSFAEKIN